MDWKVTFLLCLTYFTFSNGGVVPAKKDFMLKIVESILDMPKKVMLKSDVPPYPDLDEWYSFHGADMTMGVIYKDKTNKDLGRIVNFQIDHLGYFSPDLQYTKIKLNIDLDTKPDNFVVKVDYSFEHESEDRNDKGTIVFTRQLAPKGTLRITHTSRQQSDFDFVIEHTENEIDATFSANGESYQCRGVREKGKMYEWQFTNTGSNGMKVFYNIKLDISNFYELKFDVKSSSKTVTEDDLNVEISTEGSSSKTLILKASLNMKPHYEDQYIGFEGNHETGRFSWFKITKTRVEPVIQFDYSRDSYQNNMVGAYQLNGTLFSVSPYRQARLRLDYDFDKLARQAIMIFEVGHRRSIYAPLQIENKISLEYMKNLDGNHYFKTIEMAKGEKVLEETYLLAEKHTAQLYNYELEGNMTTYNQPGQKSLLKQFYCMIDQCCDSGDVKFHVSINKAEPMKMSILMEEKLDAKMTMKLEVNALESPYTFSYIEVDEDGTLTLESKFIPYELVEISIQEPEDDEDDEPMVFEISKDENGWGIGFRGLPKIISFEPDVTEKKITFNVDEDLLSLKMSTEDWAENQIEIQWINVCKLVPRILEWNINWKLSDQTLDYKLTFFLSLGPGYQGEFQTSGKLHPKKWLSLV